MYIPPNSLCPGQWIAFETNQLTEDKKGPYKVIIKPLYTYIYTLMNVEGKLISYDFTSRTVDGDSLKEEYKMILFTKEEILVSLGDKNKIVNDFALTHLERIARKSDFGLCFHPIDPNKVLDELEIKEWFDLLSGFKQLYLAKQDKNCSMYFFFSEIFNLIAKQLVNNHSIPFSVKK